MPRRSTDSDNWGGPRKGAGRPARRFILERGRRVLVHQRGSDGCTPGQMATVELHGTGRNRTLILKQDNGIDIIITL